MTRSLASGLTEFDYLTQSDDRTRHGALRFLDSDLVPRLVKLEKLRTLAHQFERDPEQEDEAVRDLADVAGSLGGARPKASVEGEGKLWIAKFTSRDDRRAVERAEIATLRLAARCGLPVPEARLELVRSDSPVALLRRFGRRGDFVFPIDRRGQLSIGTVPRVGTIQTSRTSFVRFPMSRAMAFKNSGVGSSLRSWYQTPMIT